MEFLHNLTGTVMYVADDRAGEYLAAGHRMRTAEPAAPPPAADDTQGGDADAVRKRTGRRSRVSRADG